jgi:hypothetical protein
MKAFDHSGHAAVVTGGNGGIGLGMARGLAKAGANVAIAGRNAEKNAAAVGELQALGARVLAIEADVTVEQDCRRLVEATAARFGRLDILVNNAGIALRKRPEDYTAHDWHLVIDSNLTSAFLCSHAAYPHMTKADGGKIINIGSILATMSAPFAVAYSASKGGIVPDDACAGHRLGPRQYPGQRAASRLDQHGTDGQRAPRGRRIGRSCLCLYRTGPRAGGFRGGHGSACRFGLAIHHRCRHSSRWWILNSGLKGFSHDGKPST